MACIIYESKPIDFEPKFETAACFIESQEAFLLLQRQENKPFGETWCLPGGKRNKGETLINCVLREIQEETGFELDPSVITPIRAVYVENSGLRYAYHMFRAPFPEKRTPKLRKTEHVNWAWKKPEEALIMNLIPGQHECINIAYRKQ